MRNWWIMLRDMRVLYGIYPSFIIGNISLGILVKYDCKFVWPCRIKSIWDIRLIRHSIYLRIKRYKYWSIQGWQNICLVINIDTRTKKNGRHEHYHEKVSSDHLAFLSLGSQWCVARYRSLFIIFNIGFNIVVSVTKTYRVTHKITVERRNLSKTYKMGVFSK